MARRLLICLLHCVNFTLSASTEISGPGVCMPPDRLVIALINLNTFLNEVHKIKITSEHVITLRFFGR